MRPELIYLELLIQSCATVTTQKNSKNFLILKTKSNYFLAEKSIFAQITPQPCFCNVLSSNYQDRLRLASYASFQITSRSNSNCKKMDNRPERITRQNYEVRPNCADAVNTTCFPTDFNDSNQRTFSKQGTVFSSIQISGSQPWYHGTLGCHQIVQGLTWVTIFIDLWTYLSI